jgi:RNA polymerase sigma factor (sigma-70 family)
LIFTAYPPHPINLEKRPLLWRNNVQDGPNRAAYIYSHFFQPLYYVVDRMINCPAESEDIVMNVIYKVINSQNQPQTLDHLRRRLFVSVRNEAITYFRRRTQHQKAVSYLSGLQHNPGYSDGEASENVQEKVRQLISAEIRRLPPQRRKILHLYFFAKKSTAEISKELSISAQTVLNHKAKALHDLRNCGLIDRLRNLVEC